jgi:iron complex transport system substrate-binding protein
MPERIVAVAPALVEILFELGLGERVVGVGSYSRWPPEVEEKTRIGGLIDPRLETVVELQPDLAVLLPSERTLARALADLGIDVLVLPVETIEDLVGAIETIGGRTGSQERARELIERLHSGIEPRGDATRLEVLLIAGREPGNLADVYAAASGTFLDELLERLGAVNVFADSRIRYPNVGLEEILVRSPDVIVELQPERLSEKARVRLVDDWQGVTALPESCIAVIEGDYTLLPGPRLPMLYRQIGDAILHCGVNGA